MSDSQAPGGIGSRADALLAAVDMLAPTLESSNLDEVELQVGEVRLRLARSRSRPGVSLAPADASVTATAPMPAPGAATGDGKAPFGEAPAGMRHVVAPLTGIWYAAPSPGARPYVTPGQEVTAGQVVGLIEAMKLFNEIKSDVSGTVSRVLVESGTLVKRTQPLIEVGPA